MIKVGQVYQTERLEIVLITRVVGFHFYIITPSGMTGEFNNIFKDVWSYWKLIAEYPTWQEAVNSKEFKVGE